MWHRRIRSGIIFKTTLFFGIFFKKTLFWVKALTTRCAGSDGACHPHPKENILIAVFLENVKICVGAFLIIIFFKNSFPKYF